jgi:hypothetical protein
MKAAFRHRWGFVIATVVAVAVVAGSAFARPNGSTAPITAAQAKSIAKAVADREIGRLGPTLSVKTARTAGSATAADAPAMYAQVTAGGTVTTNARGIAQANLVRPRSGLYCFLGLPGVPKGGVAIIDEAIPGPGSGVDLIQFGLGRFTHRIGSCPEGTQAYVDTFTTAGDLVDDPFFVVLWL